MRIIHDTKLDFSDVLITPKRSSLSSRSQVNLLRNYNFINYSSDSDNNYDYSGIPLMAANMDGVGTLKMADTLSQLNIFTCLVKTYSVNEIVDFFQNDSHSRLRTEHVAMTIGITDNDYNKFKKVYELLGEKLKYLCIDVANGYSQTFVDFVKKVKLSYSNVIIIAGNVATGEMVEELLLSGASIVKCGIGSGKYCFDKDTEVKTENGYKKIKDISIGDNVLTHNNNYKKVTNKFENKTTELLKINGITCTPDHKFFVVDKKHKDAINEDNYKEIGYWLEAKNIDKNKHFLVSL